MPDGLYITRTEWNQLIKKVEYLQQYVKNSLREKRKSTWILKKEAASFLGQFPRHHVCVFWNNFPILGTMAGVFQSAFSSKPIIYYFGMALAPILAEHATKDLAINSKI